MKTAAFALAAASFLQSVASHATVYNILVNDVNQGLGNSASGYIRTPPNNNPVTNVASSDMTCNVNGGNAAAKYVNVKGGDKITFEWHHNDNTAADDIIADSHKGPVMVYIAPAASNGKGNVWVKLIEEGWSNGVWAVDNLIRNRGKHSVVLPNLAAGDYLLRPEIIALHEGNRQAGAQFYMECVQVRVTSSGSLSLPGGVAIPGTYSANDAGVLFNIYTSFSSYPIPGPRPWNGAGGSNPPPASSPAPAPTTLRTSTVPQPTGGNGGSPVAKYGQCGGTGYAGSTTCASGSTCQVINPYYHQCL
ncbi:carbohydrate-binding module family 1 protein [Sporormia fimetaria CBS 119925]|uniref:AA9 family lytic polysaccharide monooxygenase n=1 Tax=Sporormia fimetaria CBS 119925 TaxID=1340428 RepID=A0A6A6UVT4_9PLEO|nr:carbohydrate-binding module family 1 protein [Sporormia fimetaria CBS 119925]